MDNTVALIYRNERDLQSRTPEIRGGITDHRYHGSSTIPTSAKAEQRLSFSVSQRRTVGAHARPSLWNLSYDPN